MTFSWHTQTRPDPSDGKISVFGSQRTALVAKARKVVGWSPHAETSSAPVVDAHTQVGSQRKGLMMPSKTFSAALALQDGELHVYTPPDALLSCTKTARKILVRAVSADAIVFFFSLLARANKQSPPTYLRARKRNPRHVLVHARHHARHAHNQVHKQTARIKLVVSLTLNVKPQLERPVAEGDSKTTMEPGIHGINSEKSHLL